jgi:hypothetical protein
MVLALLTWPAARAEEPSKLGAVRLGRLTFRMQEIDRSLKVGYAVLPTDINADGRTDLVVVDTERVIWFENPSWKLRTIIAGGTQPDNVCIDAADLDGDGKVELALGAGWRPSDTLSGGTLQWLRRQPDPSQPWTVHAVDAEPTLHRHRFADLDGDGRKELVVAPLFGRGTTRAKNFAERGVRLLAFTPPADPARPWARSVIDDRLHVMHNFEPVDFDGDGRLDLLTASYDGVHLHVRAANGSWSASRIGAGNQTNPAGSRGASEIRLGRLKGGTRFIATIEPWHGNEVVVYTEPAPAGSGQAAAGGNGKPDSADRLWTRTVLDNRLLWGHAVRCVDLDGDGSDELVIGVRDALSPAESRGVRLYAPDDLASGKWSRRILENGPMATEDLTAADLDADGRPELIAVGRATGNVRIYWNETPKPGT